MPAPAPHVRDVEPDAPEWLDELIHRCMEKDRTRRVQTMAELQNTIQAVVGDGSLQRGDQTGPVRLARASQRGLARPLPPPPLTARPPTPPPLTAQPSTLSGGAGQLD